MQSTWDLKNPKIETKRGINLHLVHEILSHQKVIPFLRYSIHISPLNVGNEFPFSAYLPAELLMVDTCHPGSFRITSSWWFQPIPKKYESNWIILPGIGVHIKNIESHQPERYWCIGINSWFLFSKPTEGFSPVAWGGLDRSGSRWWLPRENQSRWSKEILVLRRRAAHEKDLVYIYIYTVY